MLIVKLYQKIILLLVCCTIFLSSCRSSNEPAVRKVAVLDGELGVTLAYSPSVYLLSITKLLSSDTRLPASYIFTPG